MVRLPVVALASALLTASCSSLNEIDVVKEPNKAVGKTFAVRASRTVLASTNSEAIWTLEKGFQDKAQANVRDNVAKEGRIMGAIDTLVNVKKFAKEANKGISISDLGIANINVNAQHQHDSEELNVVVEDVAKTDTTMPILKVRVVNKGYAGQEMWIAATVVKRSGHEVNYKK